VRSIGHRLLNLTIILPAIVAPAARAQSRDDRPPDRLATQALSHEKAGRLDSAAASYRLAADSFPLLRDWLLLRAAGLTADSAERESLYSTVIDPLAASRIPWTEAAARERTGDWWNAARRFQVLGAALPALRLRLRSGGDSGLTAGRRELLGFLRAAVPAEVEAALALFDESFPDRTPAEELQLGRRAAAAGLHQRAARGFQAAKARLTDRDRLAYAASLARLGRREPAIAELERVRSPELAAEAAFQRARLLLRSGQRARAIPALTKIPASFPRDSQPASGALFLRADLLVDRGHDDSARILFLAAASQYPTTPFGRRGGFQAAIIALVDQRPTEALLELERIEADPGHPEAIAANYWISRLLEGRGDSTEAHRRYRALIARRPEGYYAARAAERLGIRLWSFGPEVDDRPDSLPVPLQRAGALERLGFRAEAEWELNAFVAGADSAAPEAMVPDAMALAAGGWTYRALRLGQRAQQRGAALDRRLGELLYPLPFREIIVTERAGDAPPSLIAALIRQESAFNPEARSVADARGLMQILPAVGAELAAGSAVDWDPLVLYRPDVNLDLGIRHLTANLTKLGSVERALAAYNAGQERVARWQTIRGVEDPEIFVERIPFVETRDYVRRVVANRAMYQALYPELSR
jgi:soluble lytic murein transglycosylase